MKISKDTTLLLTSGEYDDYSVNFLVIALKDFDMLEQKTLYTNDSYMGFAKFLIDGGYIAELSYEEINLGSYDSFIHGDLAY